MDIKKGLYRLVHKSNIYASYLPEQGLLKHELYIEKGQTIEVTDVHEGVVYFIYQKTDFKSAEHHIEKYFKLLESEETE